MASYHDQELNEDVNSMSTNSSTSLNKEKQFRNILIIGKVGAGKSTVANAIFGEDKFQVAGTVHSFTRHIRETGVKEHDNGEYVIRIKLIDTIDVEGQAVCTEEMSKLCQQEFQGGLNLILLVYKQGRLTQQERSALDDVISNLNPYSNICALVVTCCEHKSKNARQAIIADIEGSEDTFKLKTFVGNLGIYPVGLPNIKEIDIDDAEFKEKIEKKIDEDKKCLQGLMMRAEIPEEVGTLSKFLAQEESTTVDHSSESHLNDQVSSDSSVDPCDIPAKKLKKNECAIQ